MQTMRCNANTSFFKCLKTNTEEHRGPLFIIIIIIIIIITRQPFISTYYKMNIICIMSDTIAATQ